MSCPLYISQRKFCAIVSLRRNVWDLFWRKVNFFALLYFLSISVDLFIRLCLLLDILYAFFTFQHFRFVLFTINGKDLSPTFS